MIPVQYTALTALQPVSLNYSYSNENILKSLNSYNDGLSIYAFDSLKNYQDVVVNKNTSLVLTSSIKLDQIFTAPKSTTIGQVPGTVKIQPRNRPTYYWYYNFNKNYIELSTVSSNVYVSPVQGTDEVELLVDNKYLQVDFNYPFTVRLNNRSIDPESINRQRFKFFYENGTGTFLTKTASGFRYLSINQNTDNILRATGLILNNRKINDYVFKIVQVSDDKTHLNFKPTNNFVTYYFDVENAQENLTTTINKNLTGIPNNFLFTFATNPATNTKKANIDIITLKNISTPTGGISPIDNSYSKDF